MDEDYLSFNGVDGATGGYLLPPMPVQSFAQAIRNETFGRDQLGELRARRDSALPDFGMVFGRDPEDLAQAGWAMIAAESTPPDVLEALEPLCGLRESQATTRFCRRAGTEGYVAGKTKRQFLADFGMAPASPANPDKFPYYVLLVGGPDEIPFEFQYQLDVQYAVGRLHFDTADEYASYAEAVVAAEKQQPPGALRSDADRVGLFAPENRADRATQLSARQLVAPLAAEVRPPGQEPQVDVVIGEEASKERLLELLCGPQAPGLLFTASHGVAFPSGDPRQRATQGALLCQNWPGPLLWNQPLSEDFYLAAADIPQDAMVTPRVVFAFACYGAGTPQTDDYARLLGAPPVPPADAPFVARLPQRLLGRPRAATLAFVGHVERAWGCSFMSPSAGASRETFWAALQALLAGRRVGHAMEYFDDKYAALAAELSDTLDAARNYGLQLDDLALAGLWTENNDARSYVVLGDPAVRLAAATPVMTSP
jgi:hypothetical protein